MTLNNKNAIADYLRTKTGMNISQIAKKNGISRKCLYEAINGNGSRRLRVEIAKMLKIPPSLIWKNNNTVTRTIDDLHYLGVHND